MSNLNEKVNRLTFIRQTTFNKHPKALYKCICGKEKEIRIYYVKTGHTQSCGCYRIEQIIKKGTKHGLKRHPLYKIWHNIVQRCTNPNYPDAHLYYKKGVELCPEWRNNPEKFIKWALDNGWQKGLHIDKDIKAKKEGKEGLLYSPDWCSVVTRKENNRNTIRNRYIEYNGMLKCVTEWSEYFGIHKITLWQRLKNSEFDMYAYMKKWGNKTKINNNEQY